jgi:hypothetical protein
MKQGGLKIQTGRSPIDGPVPNKGKGRDPKAMRGKNGCQEALSVHHSAPISIEGSKMKGF